MGPVYPHTLSDSGLT